MFVSYLDHDAAVLYRIGVQGPSDKHFQVWVLLVLLPFGFFRRFLLFLLVV